MVSFVPTPTFFNSATELSLQSHHWQNTVGDASLRATPPQFDNAFTNPLTGRPPASFNVAQLKEAIQYYNAKSLKADIEAVYPTSGFESLSGVASHFTSDKNGRSMVVVWDGKEGSGDKYTRTGAHMKNFVADLLPGTSTKLVEYGNAKEAKLTSASTSDYRGKVIVAYDSATRKYAVWMAAAQLSGPLLSN